MIRRPPRSTQSRSSAASDVYKRQALGFVNTAGLLGQVVAGEGEAPRAAPTAHPPVLAATAAALQQRGVAQLPKEGGVAVDLIDRLLPHVSGRQLQESRGAHLADMGDEAEALAVVH